MPDEPLPRDDLKGMAEKAVELGSLSVEEPAPPARKKRSRRRRSGRRSSSRHRAALDRAIMRNARLVAGLRGIRDQYPETEEYVNNLLAEAEEA